MSQTPQQPQPMKYYYFECACHSPKHRIAGFYDPDDNFVYLSIHLPRQTLWRRLVKATKYVLGKEARYGHWDEIVVDETQKDNWIELFSNLKEKFSYSSHTMINRSE